MYYTITSASSNKDTRAVQLLAWSVQTSFAFFIVVRLARSIDLGRNPQGKGVKMLCSWIPPNLSAAGMPCRTPPNWHWRPPPVSSLRGDADQVLRWCSQWEIASSLVSRQLPNAKRIFEAVIYKFALAKRVIFNSNIIIETKGAR